MKNNHVYVGVAVIIIIAGLILFNKKEEVVSPADTDTTNTTADSNQSTNQKPQTTGGSTVKPSTKPSQTLPSVPPPSGTVITPKASELNGLVFKLYSYNGIQLPADSRYVITFNDGRLNAKFCNTLSGVFVLNGNVLSSSNFVSTQIYCSSPEKLMEMESSFASMINFGAVVTKSGNYLTLSGKDGTIMVFVGFN